MALARRKNTSPICRAPSEPPLFVNPRGRHVSHVISGTCGRRPFRAGMAARYPIASAIARRTPAMVCYIYYLLYFNLLVKESPCFPALSFRRSPRSTTRSEKERVMRAGSSGPQFSREGAKAKTGLESRLNTTKRRADRRGGEATGSSGGVPALRALFRSRVRVRLGQNRLPSRCRGCYRAGVPENGGIDIFLPMARGQLLGLAFPHCAQCGHRPLAQDL